MQHVNLYIVSTGRGPRRQDIYAGYMLEAFKPDETPVTREGYNHYEDMTSMQAELHILIEALRRLNTRCEIAVIGSEWVVNAVSSSWIEMWSKWSWITTSGEPVQYKEQWIEVEQILNNNECTFINDVPNPYRKVMEQQIKKMKENGYV